MKDDEKEGKENMDIESQFCEDGLDIFETVYPSFKWPENKDDRCLSPIPL